MDFLSKNKIYQLFSFLNNRRKKHIYFLFILILLNGIVESLSISTVIPFLSLMFSKEYNFDYTILDRYIPINVNNSDQLFSFFTLLFCFFIVFSTFFRIFNNWYILKLTAKIDTDLSNLIFKNNIYQPYLNYTKKSSSRIISLILEKVAASASALNSLFKILQSSIIGLFIIVSLLFFNWKIVIISFIFLYIFYILISKKVRKILYKNGQILSINAPLRIKILQESFIGFRDIIINSTENIYFNLFDNHNSIIKDKNANSEFLISTPKYLIEGISFFFISITAYFIAKSNTGITNMIATIGAFIYALQRLLPLIQQTYAAWASFKVKSAYINDILQELNNVQINKRNFNKMDELNFNNKIVLKNISYSYDQSNNILKNINLEINKGDHIGIYGETGSGKSTFLDILMGLLPPSKGSIYIDKINISQNNYQNYWTSKISHVPQTVFLKEGSIAENIAFGEDKLEIDFDLLNKAANVAQLENFIKQSSLGFQSVVGERGIMLSGGQRQRIAIARAIYKSRDILILDEATSALDEDTEKKIIKSILRDYRKLTVIMVTHRLSSLENCNRIFKVTSQGEIFPD